MLATVVAVLDLILFGVVVGLASASRPAIRFWGAITLSLAALDVLRLFRLADLLRGGYLPLAAVLLVASHLAVLRFRSLVARRRAMHDVAVVIAVSTVGSAITLTAIQLAGIPTVSSWFGVVGMVVFAWWCGALADVARATWAAAGRLRSPARARRQRVLAMGLAVIVLGLVDRGVGWYVQVDELRSVGQLVTLCGMLLAVVALSPATFGVKGPSPGDIAAMLRMSRELVKDSDNVEEMAALALAIGIETAGARWGYVVDVDQRILASSPSAPAEPRTQPGEGTRQHGVTVVRRPSEIELWLPMIRGSQLGYVVLALWDLDPLFGGEDLRLLASGAVALGPALDRVESTAHEREQYERNERLVAELEIREWALAEAQHIAQMGSWTWQIGATAVQWSDELFRVYGEDPATFVPTLDTYRERIHPEDRSISDEAVQGCIATGEPWCVRYRIVRPDGSIGALESRGRPLQVDDDGTVTWLTGTCRDVTSEETLIASLRALGRRVTDVQEHERRELALQLHDDVGQIVTGLDLQLQAHEQACGEPELLAEARQRLRDLHERVRSISLDLRPAVLDDLGLGPALRWLARIAAKTSGGDVDVRVDVTEQVRYSEEVEIAAYRIVQEAITNALRHAAADEVVVTLRTDATALVVEISDDGRGFDPRAVPVTAAGVSGMRERASWLGGSLVVDSEHGAGTRITARLPVVAEPASTRGGTRTGDRTIYLDDFTASRSP